MHGRVVVLEGGQHVAIGQAQVGVRMREAAHLVEGGNYLGTQRIADVQNEAAPGIVVVGLRCS